MLMLLSPVPCEAYECLMMVTGEGERCTACRLLLCRNHHEVTNHVCTQGKEPSYVQEQYATVCDISRRAVIEMAERNRPGHTATIEIPENIEAVAASRCSSFNLLFPITFDDGMVWLLRVPTYAEIQQDPGVIKRMKYSEVLTHALLRKGGLPVPKIENWGIGSISKTDNPKCAHVMVERVKGTECSATMDTTLTRGMVSEEFMRGIALEWAELSLQLEKMKYDVMGSPDMDDKGNIVIGAFISPLVPDQPEYPYHDGPFKSQRARWVSRLDRLAGHILKGWRKRDRPLVVYLALRHARALVMGCEWMAKEEFEFYIWHPDSHGGNIMSHEGKITALIDWEWMSTSTKAEAFAAPKWAFDTEAFDYGDNALSKEEVILAEAYESLGRDDLADCVRGGKVFQRLHRIILNWTPSDRGDKRILAAVNGLTDAFLGKDAGPLPKTLNEWITAALVDQRDDPHLPSVIALNDRIMSEELAMAQRQVGGEEMSCSGSVDSSVLITPSTSQQELSNEPKVDEARGDEVKEDGAGKPQKAEEVGYAF